MGTKYLIFYAVLSKPGASVSPPQSDFFTNTVWQKLRRSHLVAKGTITRVPLALAQIRDFFRLRWAETQRDRKDIIF